MTWKKKLYVHFPVRIKKNVNLLCECQIESPPMAIIFQGATLYGRNICSYVGCDWIW